MIPNTNIWNAHLLLSLFDQTIINHILNIIPGVNYSTDKLQWLHTKKGLDTVKSMYNSLINNSDNPNNIFSKTCLRIWKNKAPPRADLFTLKCFNNLVPVKERLGQHINIPSLSSPFCDFQYETLHHLLLDCPYSQAVWFLTNINFRLVHFKNLPTSDWISLCSVLLKIGLLTLIYGHLSALLQPVGIYGNKGAIRLLITGCSDLINLHQSLINSFSDSETHIGIRIVIRDSKGTFISAGANSGNVGNSEEGECTGLLAATIWARIKQVKHLEIETDHRGAAEALNGRSSNLTWGTYFLLVEVISMFKYFTVIKIKHCNKEGNCTTHLFESQANLSFMVSHSYSSPPSWLTGQLEKDMVLCNLNLP
ncbi:Reverse transcriptase zinc-binding domain [Thalictrum thalictroides]|uniref:Reverse transcriptase zinc-binding domain n=1 Tax=Thalictrum thalictroides TaxID=46969 RepID=A0A7J6WLN2_THATH|nr:Reverse transcriptase zinc-binding domain [Thalictrum thalictroides]